MAEQGIAFGHRKASEGIKHFKSGVFMTKESEFVQYARAAVKEYKAYNDEQRNMMVDAVRDSNVETVLDVGCGAGQLLLPFAERLGAFCVGIDIGEEVGTIEREIWHEFGLDRRILFVRACGEVLPLACASFDVVICRVALPYMNITKTLAEIARVLGPDGKLFLKIHSPAFYVRMVKNRLPKRSLKQLAYPLLCLFCGTVNLVTGKQLYRGFWKGKETFLTRKSLEKALAGSGLRIIRELNDTNIATPSFLIEKCEPVR